MLKYDKEKFSNRKLIFDIMMGNDPTHEVFSQPMARIGNLIKACKNIHHQLSVMARNHSSSLMINPHQREYRLVHAAIKDLADKVEEVCAKQKITPAHLPTPSRRAYSWLRFLSELEIEDNWRLTQHLETLAMAYHAIERNLKKATPLGGLGFWKNKNGFQANVSIYYNDQLYQVRYKPPLLDIGFHEGFIGAPPQIIDGIIRIALRLSSEEVVKQVRHYSKTEAFQEIAALLGSTVAIGQTRGKVYDLDVVFDRVNKDYFSNRIARPRLTWGDRLTRRKYGHYQPNEDTLLISRTLDNAFIPRYFIEFIMYHELLHKALGAKIVNGRRYVHTPEFRAAEKEFKEYEKAQAFMAQLAKKFPRRARMSKNALLRRIARKK